MQNFRVWLVALWMGLVSLSLGAVEPVKFMARLDPKQVAPNGEATLVVEATIDPGWHLYSMVPAKDGPVPTEILLTETKGLVPIGRASQSEFERKLDPNFGVEVELFSDKASFRVPVRVDKSLSGAQMTKIQVFFQACNDRSCLPPRTVDLPISFEVAGEPAPDSGKPVVTSLTPEGGAGTAEPEGPAVGEGGNALQDPAAKVKAAKDSGLLAFLGLAISAGFLALLTPCVFPMIPITVSIFAKKGQQEGGKSGVAQAVAFCLGIISTFTVLGVATAVLFGASGIQRLATNPYLNIALGVLFVVLALSLFGVFEIGIPASWTNKINPRGKQGLAGPILMGLVFTLTSFTCTMPFVGTLLVTASQGAIVYPILGMLGFSTAFALPFFLLALFPQALAKMPKSGGWLATIKAFMGFLELAAAVKFISNVDLVWQVGWLTRPVFLAVWAVLFALAGSYLLGWIRLPKVDDAPKLGPVRLGFGVATLAATLVMLGAINGRPLGELDAFLPPVPYPGQEAASAGTAAAEEDKRWLKNYDEALTKAKEAGKPVLIDFTGVTCTNCRWMEKNMFPRPDVSQEFENYVLVKLFTDRPTPEDQANQKLQEKLTGSVTLPIYVALGADGKPKKIFEGSTRDPGTFVQFLKEGR